MSTPLGPSGWHPDPLGRYEYRYYNGREWTADVSVQGQRFLDPAGATPVDTRGKGMAMASFVIGLVSLLGAWIPFVFAIAAAGALAALVFGIVALRRKGEGHGFAVAGIVLSVCALLACIAGFMFTRVVLREVTDYLDPGPYTRNVTVCTTTDGGAVQMEGTLTNDDVVTRSYTVVVQYRDGNSLKGTENFSVNDLAPGDTATLTSKAFVTVIGTPTCDVTVYGPTPFDVPQKDLGTP